MKKKDYFILILLALIPILLVYLIVPSDKMFAHYVDWTSQHVVIPDYFRQLFYQSGDFFPDFAFHLGGGSNIYAFSYYGLFRPDILISYLLPSISIAQIIITYMMLMMSLAACLCYVWLRKKGYTLSICTFTSFLLICSSLFFQSHKQIMFVNYLPYLFMALMAIDYYIEKKKSSWLILSILLIILHSYFFSIAAIIICLGYYLYESSHLTKMNLKVFWYAKLKEITKFMIVISIAILCAAILLLPTAMVILDNVKSSATTSFNDIFTMSLDIKGLLYDPYGCGLPMLAWICLVLGTLNKRTRKLSITLSICFLLPIVAYLLNGTLYARTKILIVLLPLVLLVIADVLTQIKDKQLKLNYYLLPFILMPLFFYSKKSSWIMIDILCTGILLFIYHKKAKPQTLIIMAIIPLYFLVQTNNPDEFLDKQVYENATNPEKLSLIQQNDSALTGRSDDFTSPLINANRVNTLNEYKTSSYTSTNNTLYNNFYYDVIKNPISIVNRVANLSNSNIFFQGLMGVTTIYTNQKIPIGYAIKKQNKNITITENKNVLPLAYATNQLISEKTFDQLVYPYTLDTLYNNAVVKEGNHNYQSQIKKIELDYHVLSKSKQLTLNKNENHVQIDAKKVANLKLALNQDISNQILLISFDLKDIKKAKTTDTTITINGIKNKLSRDNAPYPNGNTHFTYIISSNEDIKNLNITFSKGSYTLTNIEVYTLDYDVIKNRGSQVTALKTEKPVGKEVMKGTISILNDGYFITSLPYQKGYKVYVDGKETNPEIVNKAFLGFPLKQGEHSITIEYHAPLKTISMYLSILGLILFLVNWIMERKNNNEK